MIRLGKKLETKATKVSAPHLDLITFTTDAIAAPGTHFSLVLDVTPGRRVHVYAPGVTGYKAIALTIVPLSGLIARAAQFPKPTDHFFKPLNEHVNVFDRPFRIIQDVMIDASRDSEALLTERSSLTIEATLDYQACDDKVCFNPQSVPVSWTVALKPLDPAISGYVNYRFLKLPATSGMLAVALVSSLILVAGMLSIVVVLVARLVSVGVPVSAMSLRRRFKRGVVPVLTWSGLRGGLSVAMALWLPPFRARGLILGCTYAVVVFSILAQGLTVRRLLVQYGIGEVRAATSEP